MPMVNVKVMLGDIVEQAVDAIVNAANCTLLGGGGVATAMAVQTALEGAAEIAIFNRPGKSFDRVDALAEKLNARTSCKVKTYNLHDGDRLKGEIAESCILANGTSLGMAPNTDTSPISDLSVFHNDLLVTDAKSCGCEAFGGLAMLLYQGAAAFKLWTGEELPVEYIKEKLFE